MPRVLRTLRRAARAAARRLWVAEGVQQCGEPLSPEIRARFVALGLTSDELDALDLREASIRYPEGWRDRGNRIYLAAGVGLNPEFVTASAELGGLSGVAIVLGSPIDGLAVLGIHGDDASVFIGPECWLPSAQVHCGGGSSVVLRRLVTCTFAGHLDARNGGAIFADTDQLWASRVYIATDDMHSLLDAETGARLNPRGGRIRLARHVWLGQESVVLGGAHIAEDSVVGMRSMVRAGSYPEGSVLVGTPARIARTGVTWSREDVTGIADYPRPAGRVAPNAAVDNSVR
ncbi:hypothetical protein FVA74_04010 [Salinibacterium sp. dk2585]|uniref:hypothetical protein n=1 Tax=unclassified Salinibacterium TaxID=2632331 RepID=UPI0011C250D2|nr:MULTISPECIES: hypothetical protein [unclassified Salinibacterium]QEE60833.1 hypothetical protein FVA74_04010 [Salinibacterium sp. dk2585]TXK55905.1 hypothetical protein FVP63_04155 [Salinibacterium sp. dk5596]